MSFKISVRPEEDESLNSVLCNLIVSASYFGKRNIDFELDKKEFTFYFNGYCPNDYLDYLSRRFDLSLSPI